MSARLARFAFPAPRALLVTAPGATAQRLAVERELRRRAGSIARSAADADTLVTCGALSTSLEQLADRVYDAMPAPRARTRVLEPEEAPVALDEAVAALRDLDAQRTAAAQRHETAAARELLSGGDEDGIAGLPMAEQAEDRDGLMLDQLHLRLGPVLPDWPAGLIVDVAVQGDVIQEATVDVVPPAPGAYHGPAFWDAGATASEAERRRRTAAAHLDSAARLLGVAGWADAASDARRLRDATLDGAPPVDRVRRLRRRVERSRTLRWSLSGLGVLDHDDAVARGVEGPARRAGGDVHDRLRQWLTEAEEALVNGAVPGEGPRGTADERPSQALLEAIPDLIRGLDLGTARLVVASLDPDLDQLVDARGELARG